MEPSGFLIINKPKNCTSHDVVALLRKITGIKKIGHSGTLDPLATGLLLIAVGRTSTKQLGDFIKLDKTYEAVIKLGAASETYDAQGPVTPPQKNAVEKNLSDVWDAVRQFTGNIKQIPPMHSAKKVKGKKLYELARKGKKIAREPAEISIYEISILDYSWPFLTLRIHCSSGTYIRSIAHDIGKALRVGGYLEELKRTAIANIALKNSVLLSKITSENWKEYMAEKPIAPDYEKPKTRVIAFGTFDYLHPGHINYFEQAKKYGDKLYVIVARDKTARSVKTNPPDHNENFRLDKVKQAGIADYARLGNIDDPYKILDEIKPHVICLGYDQKSFVENLERELKKRNLNSRIIKCEPFKPKKHKSSFYKARL